MKNIRWIVVLLLLVGGGAVFGQQTKAKIMEYQFGRIRANMVKDACDILEYNDQSVIGKLFDDPTTIKYFCNALDAKKNADTSDLKLKNLSFIIGDVRQKVGGLDGANVNEYKNKINEFNNQLYKAFTPNRIREALKNDNSDIPIDTRFATAQTLVGRYFGKGGSYTDTIALLVEECECYNQGFDKYKKKCKDDPEHYHGYFLNVTETGTTGGGNGTSTKPAQPIIDQDSIAWNKCETFTDCIAYLNQNINGKYRLKAEEKAWDLLCDTEQNQTKEKYQTYLDALDNDNTHKADAEAKITEFEQQDVLNHCVNWSHYEAALKQWPNDRDFINKVDEECWVKLCKEGNDDEKDIYQIYLDVFKDYGGGNHKTEAKQRIKYLNTYLWYLLIALAAIALLLTILFRKSKKNQSQTVSDDKVLREENAAFERCSTISACDYYLNTYPSGRFVKEVIAKKEGLLDKMQKEEDEAFKACTTLTACECYLIKYPKGKYMNEVKDKLAKLKENKEKSKPKPYPKQGEWVVVGASVKGNGHIQSNMPCQDNNKFELLGKGWGVAVVSDGAGSAAHSDMGSKVVVERGVVHFKNLIEKEGWMEKNILPSDAEWLQKSYFVLKTIRNEVEMVAKKNNVDVKSLSATCLAVVFSPMGLLVVHVGDGRMGCKTMSGEWKAIMTPHKGEEANQTLFLVSDFWSIPNYVQSGVLVPESLVVKEPVEAFALMSDGCESTAWLCTTQNVETGKYYDQNKPFEGFFNPLEETLVSFHKEQVPEEERKEKWYKFIESGTKGFVKEQDDKTMVLGVFCGK